jgi:Xaa-Pro aminopeptidase
LNDLSAEARAAIVASRIEALRALVESRGAAAVMLDSRRDFAWLTLGGLNHVLLSAEAGVAPVLVTRDAAVVLAPVNEYDRIADEELRGLPLQTVSLPWWDDAAAEREARTLAGDGTILHVRDVAAELEALRSALAPEEHGRLEVLARAVDDALTGALRSVAPNEIEERLAGDIGARLASHGARLPVILVAADERIGRFRHPIPTDTPIRRRVMVVLVAERWGLHVASTQFREFQARDADVQQRAAAITDVTARMRDATTPGNRFGDVLTAARAAYAEHGMRDEWTLHHQGGSIGYAARERIAKPDDRTPIRAGMAFAWNPSAVGYKAEETLYLDSDGEQHILTTTAQDGV